MNLNVTEIVLRRTLQAAKPLLDRVGVVAAPLRGITEARRVLTIDRPLDDVRGWLEDGHARALFSGEAHVENALEQQGGVQVRFRLPDRGRALATLRPGPEGTTEVFMEVKLDSLGTGGRVRYADNAGVIALRALHRAKSLMEAGEMPSLAANPAGRPEPDPYGD